MFVLINKLIKIIIMRCKSYYFRIIEIRTKLNDDALIVCVSDYILEF